MKIDLKTDEIEFLKQSNYIEREYSNKALLDSNDAWKFAKRHSHMINLNFIKIVHEKLMIRLNPRIAGKIRKCRIYVETSKKIKECLKPDKIEKELKSLCKIFPKTESEIKSWHIQFEKIHPFVDGNGRVGRIIMNIQRLNINLSILIIHEGKEQFEYYKWFK